MPNQESHIAVERLYEERRRFETVEGAWHRPEVLDNRADRSRCLARLLHRAFGPDLSRLDVLDVGCGFGGVLRQLVEWGATPSRLVGTELLADRVAHARAISGPIAFHHGPLAGLAAGRDFDLVMTHLVMSMVQGPDRDALAQELWARTRPGGWIACYDMRWKPPRNPGFTPLNDADIARWWPGDRRLETTLIVPPPLTRRLGWGLRPLARLLSAVPFLRCNRYVMVRKPARAG